jgi:PAS domain S-box-containing protein
MVSWSAGLSLIVWLITLLILAGWFFDIELLRHPLPGRTGMNPVTALCFVAAAASIFLYTKGVALLSDTLALVPGVAGLLKLCDAWLGTNIAVDRLFFPEVLQAEISNGRIYLMVPNTAFNLTMLTIVLILRGTGHAITSRVVNYIALVIAFISLFAVIEHIYRAPESYALSKYISMSLPAAVCFMLVAVSILLLNARVGFMSSVASPFSGGVLARILIPMVIVFPILLGYLRLYIASHYPITAELGVSLLVTSIIITFFILIGYVSALLNSKDRLQRDAAEEISQLNQALAMANAQLYKDVQSEVADRRQAQAQVQAAEKRYQATLDNMIEGCQIIDFNWRYLYVNPEAAQQGHSEPAKLLGRTMMECYPGIEHTHVFSVLKRCMEERSIEHMVNEFVYEDGTTSWFELSIQPAPEGLFILSMDITRRREDEKEIMKLNTELAQSAKIYKTIASNIPGSVICLFNKEYRYLLIEGDLMPRYGFDREKMIGEKAGDVLPPEIFAGLKQRLDKSFGGEFFTSESTHAGLDAITRYVPLKDERNEVTAVMLVVIDVTELKNAQRGLAKLNVGLEHKVAERTAQLAAINKELEAFTYSVSHDLKSPLRIITGYADMLEEDLAGKLGNEGNRLIQVIIGNAERMSQLIDDLLDLSRLSRQQLNKHQVNMNDLVQSVINEQKLLYKHPFNITSDPLLPASCDSRLLRQVWVNLLSNAIKYSSRMEQPVISIGSYEQGSELVYFVKDNGVGFDMEYAGRLFGVFQRLHKKTDFEGTGVGLALVQRIILKHGGRVWAEAAVNKGAVFYFSLPAEPVPDSVE